MACCHDDHCADQKTLNSPRWRQALWIALEAGKVGETAIMSSIGVESAVVLATVKDELLRGGLRPLRCSRRG
jgi:hypothetical protein